MGVDGGEEWPKKGGARAAVVPPDHRPVPCHHLEKPHIMNDESRREHCNILKELQILSSLTLWFCSHFDVT